MKTLLPTALTLILATLTKAEDGFEKHKAYVDRPLYDNAPLVIRTWVTSVGEGSQYLWADAVIHGIMKMPKDVNISPIFKVAYRSEGQRLPIGDVTLYLEPYNPEKPELGWKLIERFDEQSQRFSKGYSHHSSQTTKKQNKPEMATPRKPSD